MSVTEAERRRRRRHRSASVLLLLLAAAPAAAGLLNDEGVLDSQVPVAEFRRRLECVSSYYGAEAWAGQRHLLRLSGNRADRVQWSLALPWTYSSLTDGGRAGRDNLLLGGALRLAGAERRRLRLGAELALPFAADALSPLAERRALARLAVIAAPGPALEAAFAYAWELRDVGPDLDGGPRAPVWSLDLRIGARPARGVGAFLLAGASRQADPVVDWGQVGGGFALAWQEHWAVELAGAAYFGAEDERTRPDYRVRLALRRDFAVTPPPTPPSDGAAGGGVTPPGGGP